MDEDNLPDFVKLELLHREAEGLRKTIADIDRGIASTISAYLMGVISLSTSLQTFERDMN